MSVNGETILSFVFNEDGSSAVNSDFYIGLSGTNAGSQYFQGEILELMIYQNTNGSESISPNNIQKIESYLGKKYGIHLNQDYIGSQ